MSEQKKISNALISVYHKDNLDTIIKLLYQHNVGLFSTGGTKQFIEEQGIPVTAVEELTGYPSILGGRVKTLHPKVFGGILSRRHDESDRKQMREYDIPEIDLVIVDLYPFEETVQSNASADDIIEKIDIGGISLIRAAAKNYRDVLIVSSRNQYEDLIKILENQKAQTNLNQRKDFAAKAFAESSYYDTVIFNYFNNESELAEFRQGYRQGRVLRYGENPHQKGIFFGDFDAVFDKLHGKEISYNNLLDIEAGVNLMAEFEETTFAILKHNNACGLASRSTLFAAYKDALAGDPVSAFGGILIANQPIDLATAEEIHKLFFEVIIAPEYHQDALQVLKQKKNRIILALKNNNFPKQQFRSMMNGVIYQDRDISAEKKEDMKIATKATPTEQELIDLEFANIIVKHTKSNAIVLAKNKQLVASGVGQTSRVDALNQAIQKAESFGFRLQGAVMASDAFFPFPDCVEIADGVGIKSVVQPGGSVRDQESVDYCNKHGMSMVITGVRHFKH